MTDQTPIINLKPFRAIFLVGGRTAGRHTAAEIIAKSSSVGPVVVDAFDYETRERCHAAYKIVDQRNVPAPANYFDSTIDTPSELFGGLPPRTAYQKFSKFVNDAMGVAVRGTWVVERCRYFRALQEKRIAENRRARAIVLIDDAPIESYQEIVKEFGADNCTQLVIRRDSTVCWRLELPNVKTAEVFNRGKSLEEFERAIRLAVPHLFIEVTNEIPT